MNIFALDIDPVKAAQAHCDKHVVKMILETAQILSTVWHGLPEGALYAIPFETYKPTHRHHPCTLWAGHTDANYHWLVELGKALCDEFRFRYGHGHKTETVILALAQAPLCVGIGELTPFALAMPKEFMSGDAIASYRAYYAEAKAHLLTYRRRTPPKWLGATHSTVPFTTYV